MEESTQPRKLTTAAGRPIFDNQNSLSAGPRGPLLLQDYFLHEKLAHFNRERIPERVVHAKGSGAYGTFTVTHDITSLSRAQIFSQVGNQCRIFLRFSTVGGEKGSADTERDPRGFALKFYTQGGNWDVVGNNTPVFFVKDPVKFPDFIHTQKREARSNLKSATMMWDFWSLNPESLHQVTILMSDRGTPYGYRHMHGYGSHTFSLINAENERTWVKFHFRTEQGVKNFSSEEAAQMKAQDADFAQHDLVDAIDSGNFPRWKMFIQTMTQEQAKTFRWNPFDLTKVWPQGEFPLQEVGVLELNEVPVNYHAHVEQAAFAPAHVVDGIGYSPDKMLQGRILSYPDAQRYRLGANYDHLPVNACPYGFSNYQRDGQMALGDNGGPGPNYFPNSFDGPVEDKTVGEPDQELDGLFADRFDRNVGPGDDDHYTQPGNLFRLLDAQAQRNLIDNIVGSMSGIEGPKKDLIIQRQLCHWFRADIRLGMAIAKGLGVDVEIPTQHPQPAVAAV
ncbi:catalase [Hymenobacter sediminis]|uniref:catalase n=1 Tax=Hymenobacter sediminis TaxID=2218621 RepID=UPI000DA6A3A6|nr:catalase [Hymenobacter sediminis]RPD49492.1 catalase [Hymenobacter sediminis]